MKEPQIALVGTQGTGKTVLTAVLAQRLETKTPEGLFLYPLENTSSTVGGWWDELNEGRWLPSTPPGLLIKLHWNLHVNDKVIPMWMFDSAGQDLQKLFSKGGYKDDYLSDADRQFVEQHLGSATIFLVLLNSRDFIPPELLPDEDKNVTNKKMQRESRDTVQNALAFLQEKETKPKVAFVLTAWDKYEGIIMQHWGGIDAFLKDRLPVLHTAFIESKQVAVFPVAAVANTVDGVPAPNFESTGLKALFTWIADALVQDLNEQEKIEADTEWLSDLEKRWNGMEENRFAVERFIGDAAVRFPYPDWATPTQKEQLDNILAEAGATLEAILDKEREEAKEWRRAVIQKVMSSAAVLFVVCIFVWVGYVQYEKWAVNTAHRNILTAANNAQEFANEAKRYADFADTKSAIDASDAAQKAATDARGVVASAEGNKSPQKYLLQAQSYAKNAESYMNIAKQEAEKYRLPIPEIVGWTWTYTCEPGILWGCSQHNATATVNVKNIGGAGKIRVIFTPDAGGSGAETSSFKRDETKTVSVTASDLPNHTSKTASVDIKIQGQ